MDELKDSKELESETGKADEKEERPEKESARTQQEEELWTDILCNAVFVFPRNRRNGRKRVRAVPTVSVAIVRICCVRVIGILSLFQVCSSSS